jgi:hypothetical protein
VSVIAFAAFVVAAKNAFALHDIGKPVFEGMVG